MRGGESRASEAQQLLQGVCCVCVCIPVSFFISCTRKIGSLYSGSHADSEGAQPFLSLLHIRWSADYIRGARCRGKRERVVEEKQQKERGDERESQAEEVMHGIAIDRRTRLNPRLESRVTSPATVPVLPLCVSASATRVCVSHGFGIEILATDIRARLTCL